MRSIVRTGPPPVVKWYRVYCVFMTLLSLGFILGGLLLCVDSPGIGNEDMDPEDWIIVGIFVTFLGCLSTGLFLFSLFLRPKPWTWTYHLILICLGLIIVCTLPVSIMLLIFWLEPANREYFGKDLGYMRDYLDED